MSVSINQIGRALLALGVLAALACCGYWLHFTQYMAYDDEGYVLWSYRSYFEHGALYRTVFSQYGPFPYVLYHALTALTGWAMDSELVRGLNLFYWTGCAAIAGGLTWRQTRSVGLGAAAATITFLSLIVMISEPGHPGGLLAFLTAGGALLGALAIERDRPREFALATALCGGAMLLSKINVGLFFLIAAGSWLALHTRLARLGRAALWLVALGSVASPLGLTSKLQHEQWVMIFGFLVAAGALALLVPIAAERREDWTGMRAWIWGAGGFGAIAAAVVVAAHLRGTPWLALWHGIVVDPLRHPLVYVHPLTWPAVAPWLSLAGLIAALLHPRLAKRRAWCVALSASRLVAAAGLGWCTWRGIDFSLTAFGLKFGAALVWLFAVPLSDDLPRTARQVRLWLAWVFIWQLLQAYPVAGSQTAWGGFLWFPVAVIGCHEAVHILAGAAGRFFRLILAVAAIALAAICSLGFGRAWAAAFERYHLSEPLGLPGAAALRLTADYTLNLRILAHNVDRHGGTLFSYPGMFSFNLWTGHPTPTEANVTHWFSLLNDAQQQAIIDRLEADPRSVVIVQSYLVNFLVVRDLAPRGRLHDYLLRNYAAAFRLDTYEFWVRRGRTIAASGTARFVRDPSGVRLDLIPTRSAEVATIELQSLFAGGPPLTRFAAQPNRPWTITPLAADGTAAGSAVLAASATRVDGLTRITAPLPSPLPRLPRSDYLRVVLFDRAGREIETLRFAN